MGVWLEDPNAVDVDNSLTGLAKAWDDIEEVRHGTIERKSMLVWPNPKAAGRINYETLRLNLKVVEAVVDLWVPKTKGKSRTIAIDNCKWEVGAEPSKFKIPIPPQFFSVHVVFLQKCSIIIIQVSIQILLGSSAQVKAFRGKLGLSTRPGLVHCEAEAIKSFMSLIVRRNDGTTKRVTGIPIIAKSSNSIQCFLTYGL